MPVYAVWPLPRPLCLPTAGCRFGRQPLASALQSENPATRVQASHRAGRERDRSAIPLLVERLEDPAADVRLYAIGALRRITGKTLGYRYYDSPDKRLQAVQRWRKWVRENLAAGGGG